MKIENMVEEKFEGIAVITECFTGDGEYAFEFTTILNGQTKSCTDELLTEECNDEMHEIFRDASIRAIHNEPVLVHMTGEYVFDKCNPASDFIRVVKVSRYQGTTIQALQTTGFEGIITSFERYDPCDGKGILIKFKLEECDDEFQCRTDKFAKINVLEPVALQATEYVSPETHRTVHSVIDIRNTEFEL